MQFFCWIPKKYQMKRSLQSDWTSDIELNQYSWETISVTHVNNSRWLRISINHIENTLYMNWEKKQYQTGWGWTTDPI
jgi:hypothetical protein